MKTTSTNCSPAIHLLDIVWNHACKATPHAWERLNHAMSSALSVAIGGGLRFDEDDFETIAKQYGFGYWGGITSKDSLGEVFYTQAVVDGNLSACVAFEKWKGRPPYICDAVETRDSIYLHGSFGRQRSRIAERLRFPWKGHMVTVTSMGREHFIACVYKQRPERDGYSREKVVKRFTITVDDIRKDRAERKARGKETGQ
jgi:hypothetical protein